MGLLGGLDQVRRLARARLRLDQLDRLAQRVVNACLPTRPGGAEIVNDVRINPQLERDLRVLGWRPTSADEFVAVIEIGLLEELLGRFRGVVGISPWLVIGFSRLSACLCSSTWQCLIEMMRRVSPLGVLMRADEEKVYPLVVLCNSCASYNSTDV